MAKLLHLTFCVVLATVLFDSARAATCTCTNTGTSCDTYSTFVACLKGVTVANTCADGDVTIANAARTVAEAFMKAAGCSGASTLMTSVGFVLVLSSLAYLFNGKKI